MDGPHADALFDRAVALWNARDFHGAHEDWETLWNEAEDERRDWLQGLIQYAAALFHVERGFHASGFVKLMRSAAAKVRAHDATGERIRFDRLAQALEPWHAHAAAVEQGRPLREGLPALPLIGYREGVVARPLPPEAADEEEAS
jgi:hypothetical protein